MVERERGGGWDGHNFSQTWDICLWEWWYKDDVMLQVYNWQQISLCESDWKFITVVVSFILPDKLWCGLEHIDSIVLYSVKIKTNPCQFGKIYVTGWRHKIVHIFLLLGFFCIIRNISTVTSLLIENLWPFQIVGGDHYATMKMEGFYFICGLQYFSELLNYWQNFEDQRCFFYIRCCYV